MPFQESVLRPDAPPWAVSALARFDAANGADPNREEIEGESHPRELLQARRLSAWVLRLVPDASLALRLASRCQHLCRWELPRQTYPPDRAGYLRWRADLKVFHARRAGEILSEVGCPEGVRRRVAELNLKKNLGADPECSTLEDALCLVFLEHQFADLAARMEHEKVMNALRKTWAKMTPVGRQQAIGLPYPPEVKALLWTALGAGDAGQGAMSVR